MRDVSGTDKKGDLTERIGFGQEGGSHRADRVDCLKYPAGIDQNLNPMYVT